MKRKVSSIGQTIQQSVFEKGAKTFHETAHRPYSALVGKYFLSPAFV